MLKDELVAHHIGATKLPEISHSTAKIYNNREYMGVEIELEGVLDHEISPYLPDTVICVTDYSLKYKGVELIFGEALHGKAIVDALEGITKAIKVSGATPYFKGNRGATHVHINVGDLTIDQLHNFILLSYFCEPLLLSTCSKDRWFNSFSMSIDRTRDTDSILDLISASYLNFPVDEYKYRAIGLNSIYAKGSLEFRMFNSTYDVDTILGWVNFIQEIKDVAIQQVNLKAKLSNFVHGDLQENVNTLFDRDVNITARAKPLLWDFIRDLAVNKQTPLDMQNKFSDFYKQITGVE